MDIVSPQGQLPAPDDRSGVKFSSLHPPGATSSAHRHNSQRGSIDPGDSQIDAPWPSYWADGPGGARKKKAKKVSPRVTTNTVRVRFFDSSVSFTYVLRLLMLTMS